MKMYTRSQFYEESLQNVLLNYSHSHHFQLFNFWFIQLFSGAWKPKETFPKTFCPSLFLFYLHFAWKGAWGAFSFKLAIKMTLVGSWHRKNTRIRLCLRTFDYISTLYDTSKWNKHFYGRRTPGAKKWAEISKN